MSTRKEEIAEARKRFFATPEHHHFGPVAIQREYKVGLSLAGRWRSDLGVCRPRSYTDEIMAHPMFGENGRVAPCSAVPIAKDVGCSESAVRNCRRTMGVLSFVETRSSDSYTKREGFYMDWAAPKTWRSDLCSSWQRPEGIDKHLEYLRDQSA